MLNKLKPDFTFNSYRDITPDFLEAEGILALLVDIDNTLAPYEQPEPDEEHTKWLGELKKHGIRVALVSNNKAQRVELFNRKLMLPAFPDAAKPSKRSMTRAMQALNVQADKCAVVGDQLFTDAYAGKRLGMKALIVPPIKDKTTLFFRFKRAMERPIMRSFEKEQKNNRFSH